MSSGKDDKAYNKSGKVPFANGRYLLSHRLGNGSFGDIFEGYDTVRKMRVAVKLEKKKIRFPQLEYESKVYQLLHQPPVGMNEVNPEEVLDQYVNGEIGDDEAAVQNVPYIVIGVPEIYYFDSEGDYNIMVMELCGPSLEDVFNYCHRRLSLKSVLMIADQILFRIQYLHDRGFVHRDIKPENFVFGCGSKAHILYIIDYGLSKLYWDLKKNMHLPFAEGKPLTGTARYCSANTHRGYEQSRRDDMESLGFLFVYFLKGSLPWQGIQAKDQHLKTIKIGEKKIATPLEELCSGLPTEFLKYCQYCRMLRFQDKPDYDYLRGLFRNLGKKYGYAVPTVPCTNPVLLRYAIVEEEERYEDNSSVGNGNNYANRHNANRVRSGGTRFDLPDPDPMRGYYDWQFDWFLKREKEVEGGVGQSGSTPSGGEPSINPAYRGDHTDQLVK
ncbi:casein kinase I [Angomonas deanei]|uniref:non-specific serine/threonine protein kinase n=1 Tax=Angomonas deanei TaxID=59799 RepID=A0A7G2CC04_9TRYP|nr:casein kinase I [Angomonas deanei]CAD2217338.1 Protein kinase domain/Protein tyrosine kinase, putative [Angomonas deanei]|eukprot:EPY28943.1 casein kinase I [Angomonas deanei]